MKFIKKSLSISLALITILGSIAMISGCEKNAPDSDKNSNAPAVESTDAPETTVPASTVFFDASTSYTIVRADSTSTEIVSLVAQFCKDLSALCGTQQKLTSDWVKNADMISSETTELLIGNTNRPESAEVLKDISSGDYTVRRVGNKIVIAATSYDDLVLALEAFKSTLVVTSTDNGKVVTMTGDITYRSGKTELFNESNKLADYTIVYPYADAAHKKIATKLAETLKLKFDVELPVQDDMKAEVEREILIGKTSRKESSELNSMQLMDYKIMVVGKKLVIGGESSGAASRALEYLTDNKINRYLCNELMFPTDYLYECIGDFKIAGAEDPALAEGADLRIMSFNILAEMWNDCLPIAGRDEKFAAVISSYLPDVVGVQEVTDGWYSAIEKSLSSVYKFASHTIPSSKTNYSSILYNSEKAELLECTTIPYSKGNGEFIRNLTWARFRRISDGKEYIVTCTHWDINTNADARVIQAQENAQIILDLTKKYNVPIFSCGDYNRNEDTAEFMGFIETTGMQDPKYTATNIGNRHKTTHTVGKSPDTATLVSIDHIAVSAGVEVLYYNTLVCKTALEVSDHCPIYIDVKLK